MAFNLKKGKRIANLNDTEIETTTENIDSENSSQESSSSIQQVPPGFPIPSWGEDGSNVVATQ